MKGIRLFVSTMSLLLIGLIVVVNCAVLNQATGQLSGETEQHYEEKPFYVGVTYCGSSIQEAKELIDRVKNYTNLFILQSYPLRNVAAVMEIGDYAVASKLNFAFCNSRSFFPDVEISSDYWITEGEYVPAGARTNELANAARERWGEHFIGLYYEDEPGGDMLDKLVDLTSASKWSNGVISYHNNQSSMLYYPNGEVLTRIINDEIIYYPNGTITIMELENNTFYTTKNITKYTKPIQPYKQVIKQNPIQTYDDAAKEFINTNKVRMDKIDKAQLTEADIPVFTADYGLYWWDYQSGYDFVLAELAWNHSVAQHIGLVRGAANLQGKSWGTCITWKYTHPPYLAAGEEMFEQMKMSYEAGAEYVVIFNYSENPTNPNTLQEEHFRALERFWVDVVQNSDVVHGGIKAEAVLVLPENYGWGMRRSDHIAEDFIWGIWSEDDKTQEIWNQLQSKIDQYGLKLDIVFEDANYPVAGKYDHIYYWNQNQMLIRIVLVILLITIPLVLFIIFYKFVNKKRKIKISNG